MALVVQLSDPHLLQDPEARLRGVPTRQTLADVLALALARYPELCRLVLTGDLAHDEAPATYPDLRALLGASASKARVLPGNHDDRAGLRAAFPEATGEHAESIRFVDGLEGWCLVGLDSQIPGQNEGRLGDEQRAWLANTLERHRDAPTILFVHHHPVPTGHTWLDSMGLEDAAPLAALLAGAPQVRAVCHGHIHRAFEARLGSIPVYGAPSTAFQFPANPDAGAYDLRPPGMRVLHLEGDTLRTEVVRLPRLEYIPQPKAKG